MSAKLFCRVGPLAGSECEIDLEASVGSASDNRLVLSDPSVARHQATIRFDDDAACYFLEDLSGGKTLLDGLPVQGRMRLDRLHVITFGSDHDFFFHWTPGDLPQGLKSTVGLGELKSAEHPKQPAALPTSLQSAPHIPSPPSFSAAEAGPKRVSDGAQEGTTVGGHAGGVAIPDFLRSKRSSGQPSPDQAEKEPPVPLALEIDLPQGTKSFSLLRGENVVGRSPSCSVFVEDHTLSRRHAVLTIDSHTIKIRDLGSTNKTFVKGKEIGQETEIAPGTSLAFAKIRARVVLKKT